LISLGFSASGSVPRALEAQVLRVCVEYDALHASGLAGADAIVQLKRRGFEPALLETLAGLVTAESSGERIVEIAISELRDGMVLAEDVYSMTGTLLLARGHSVKANLIERLRAMRPNLGTRQKLRVRLPD
jgi:hypothetical protein